MRSIKKNLIGVVHVYSAGQSIFLRACDDVPEGVDIREDVLATSVDPASDVESVDAQPDAESDEAESADSDDDQVNEMPAEGASREAWNTYAESVGVNPAEFSKKDSLIEALKNR